MAPTPTLLSERRVALRGRGVTGALCRWALARLGWRVECDGLPGPQGVALVYPHTSNWDFPLLVLVKGALGVTVTFWAKDTLFRWPLFGHWLRWLGGRPVLRHTPQGAVGQMIQDMRAAVASGQFMWLGLSPEGTRRRTEGWRTGFHRVAHAAGVPVVLIALDFAQRQVRFDSAWRLSGDLHADLAAFARRLAGVPGRHPNQAAPVRALAEAPNPIELN
jgi:1-acyl-sn-glycerol-3-phosphate acyltransferase